MMQLLILALGSTAVTAWATVIVAWPTLVSRTSNRIIGV